MLNALDGKRPQQIRAIAEEFIDGQLELELEQLTSEDVREISKEVEFDVKDEATLSRKVRKGSEEFEIIGRCGYVGLFFV